MHINRPTLRQVHIFTSPRVHKPTRPHVLPQLSDAEGNGTRSEVAGSYSDIRSPSGVHIGPMLFLLYENSLPGTVNSSHVAAFANDTKIYKTMKSPTDAALLQDDLSSLATWSSSAGLIFNESKCKAQRITRKHNPVSNMYHINEDSLGVISAEKDLRVIVSDKILWNKQMCDQCAKSNSMLRFVRQVYQECIKNAPVRGVVYLTLVRSHLGYVSKCTWAPQSKELIRKTERIQRRATKYIFNLPFLSIQGK